MTKQMKKAVSADSNTDKAKKNQHYYLICERKWLYFVLIAVAFFLLGIPAGLGVDRLVRWWKKRRIERYAQKWMGQENASHIPSEH